MLDFSIYEENEIEKFVKKYYDHVKPVALYGNGRGISWYLSCLQSYNITPEFIIDGNVQGMDSQIVVEGYRVISLEAAKTICNNWYIVISAPAHYNAIEQIISNEFEKCEAILFEPVLEVFQKIRAKDRRDYYRLHKKEIESTYEYLADDYSRYTFEKVLQGALTSDCKCYEDIANRYQYFPDCVLNRLMDNEIFVDLGAFTGDSIEELIEAANDHFTKIYAFEPIKENIEAGKNRIKDDRVKWFQCAVGEKEGTMSIVTTGGLDEAAHLNELSCDEGAAVEVYPLDAFEFPKVTYIKMDIEGAEVSALRGAQKTIEKNIPIMAISIYHRIDDYWMIPQYINNLNLGYELYVRHYWKCTGTDTVLFAIPKSRR